MGIIFHNNKKAPIKIWTLRNLLEALAGTTTAGFKNFESFKTYWVISDTSRIQWDKLNIKQIIWSENFGQKNVYNFKTKGLKLQFTS